MISLDKTIKTFNNISIEEMVFILNSFDDYSISSLLMYKH